MGRFILEISDEYARAIEELEALVDPETGEIPEDRLDEFESINDRLHINENEFAGKIEGYRKAIVQLTSEKDILKNEAARLLKLAKKKDNIVDRLNNFIIEAFERSVGANEKGTRIFKKDNVYARVQYYESVDTGMGIPPEYRRYEVKFKKLDLDLGKKVKEVIDKGMEALNLDADTKHDIISRLDFTDAPDKTKIKKALEEKKLVQGASIVKKPRVIF